MKTVFLTNIISNNNIFRVRQLRKYLPKNQKLKVLFCAQTESNRQWTVKEKIDFNYLLLPSKPIQFVGKDLFTYFLNPTIIQELDSFQPDHVVVGGWDQMSYQLAFLWAKLNGKRFTVWSGSTKNENSIRRILTYPFVWILLKLTDDFIAYGTKAKKYLQSFGLNSSKIKIIINDVNKNYFTYQAKKLKKQKNKIKKTLGITTKKNLIFVGQLIERKGIFDLLQVFKKIKKNYSDLGLIIVGYGQLQNDLQRYIKENKLQDIYFFGAVDQYDIPKYYAAADTLVLPSHREVWGLVVNEALYSGLKVVVSDKSGVSADLIKDKINGFVFKTKNIKDLKNKIKKTIL